MQRPRELTGPLKLGVELRGARRRPLVESQHGVEARTVAIDRLDALTVALDKRRANNKPRVAIFMPREAAARTRNGDGRLRLRRPRYSVVALKMSVLPKLAGQSAMGQGAGDTLNPASRDFWRWTSTAGQLAIRRRSVHVAAP